MSTATQTRRRWPLLVIGASAGTAVWSGWVGLGELVGFGVVHPLPGIADGVTINTAITLPIGVEAYAMYALSVATSTAPITRGARRFAWTSSVGALALGMAGQVAYHLMAADRMTSAPWPIVAAVSCLPVVVLGFASVLWHLAGQTAPGTGTPEAGTDPEYTPVPGYGERAGSTAGTETPGTPRAVTVVPTETAPGTAPHPGTPDAGTPSSPYPVVPSRVPAEVIGAGHPTEYTPVPAGSAASDTATDEAGTSGERLYSGTPGTPATEYAVPDPGAPRVQGVYPYPAGVPADDEDGPDPVPESTASDTDIVEVIVSTGTLPSLRAIKTGYRVGQARAYRIREQASERLTPASLNGHAR